MKQLLISLVDEQANHVEIGVASEPINPIEAAKMLTAALNFVLGTIQITERPAAEQKRPSLFMPDGSLARPTNGG